MTGIASARLSNHGILQPRFETPAEVVRWLGAVQAQDYPSGCWSIALRMREPSLVAVEQALQAGEIVRTWPMRGTLHFVPGSDARWMLQLLAHRHATAEATIQKALLITQTDLERFGEPLLAALSGGRRVARPDVLALIQQHGLDVSGQRGYHMLRHHAEQGLICVGPPHGKQPAYQLLAEVAPQALEPAPDEALKILATRYFTSHGPTTIDNFAAWTKLTLREARQGVELAAGSLRTFNDSGRKLITGSGVDDATRPPGPVVRLLPSFDEYILGYRDRSDVLRPEHAEAICPGGNGVFKPTIIVDGHVAGTWSVSARRSISTLTMRPFSPLPGSVRRAAEVAAARYGGYLGTDFEVEQHSP